MRGEEPVDSLDAVICATVLALRHRMDNWVDPNEPLLPRRKHALYVADKQLLSGFFVRPMRKGLRDATVCSA